MSRCIILSVDLNPLRISVTQDLSVEQSDKNNICSSRNHSRNLVADRKREEPRENIKNDHETECNQP